MQCACSLKGSADNFEEVEDMILKLRLEMNAAAEMEGVRALPQGVK